MDFETCGSGSIATDSPLLLFTQQYKTMRLTVIRTHCLRCLRSTVTCGKTH